MAKIHFELTSSPITSHVGLAFVGQALNETKLANHIDSLTSTPRRKGYISHLETAKSMIGLLCVGKPHYDTIAEYRDEPWFATALGLQKLPSPETLRQRIEQFSPKMSQVWRDFTVRQLSARPELLGEEINGKTWSVIHCDVSPLDNSDTKKEGVGWTYKKFDGYAPMFGYIGPYGLMLNNELRPGSAHSNTEGTPEWFEQTLNMAERISPHPRLIVTDSGNDSAENISLFTGQKDTDFVVKYNPRNQDVHEWLDIAQQQTGKDKGERIDIGAHAWYGQRELPLAGQHPDKDNPQTCRVVYRAVKRFAHSDGQFISPAIITIDAYWTSLDWTPEQIHEFYKKRGTSEQYHSELKSDMDVERLPSGKFDVNQKILDMAMVAYNLLRTMGQGMLKSGLVPGRKSKSKRLRLRTVMQNLMYMAGQLIHHARKKIIRIFKGHGWAGPALALTRPPDR